MVQTQASFIPASLPCPHCKTRIDLDEAEQSLGSFICPACSKKVYGLLAYWMISPDIWRETGLKALGKRALILLAIIVAVVFFFSSIDRPGGSLSKIGSLAFALPTISLIRVVLDYVKYTRRAGWVYIYRNGIDSLYGKTNWRRDETAGRGPILLDVDYENGNLLSFKLSGLWNDNIYIPVPLEFHEQAEGIVALFLTGTEIPTRDRQ
jgi:hypothetical protein